MGYAASASTHDELSWDWAWVWARGPEGWQGASQLNVDKNATQAAGGRVGGRGARGQYAEGLGRGSNACKTVALP